MQHPAKGGVRAPGDWVQGWKGLSHPLFCLKFGMRWRVVLGSNGWPCESRTSHSGDISPGWPPPDPHSGLGQPLSPPSTCNTSLLLASPTKSQADILGCFWLRAAAVQDSKTCPPLIWLQPQIFLHAVGPSLAEARGCAGGSQKCLLVHTHCSLAAGEGWEPSTSSWDSPSCLLPWPV